MLSIIIPTYNEERYLPLLLDSIKKQDFHDYEVIVADANSKDATRSIAKKYGCKIIKGGRPARGRNNGARHAKGDILLFLDADVILPSGFLKENLADFKKKKLVCAGVKAKPLSRSIIDNLGFAIANLGNYMLVRTQPRGIGWCIFIRKKVFNEINGFNENLLVGEDIDLTHKTKKYNAFGILKKKSIYVSIRRMEKEGRWGYVSKIIKTTVSDLKVERITLDNKEIKYKFGGYGRIKKREFPKIK